jgi:hypothetical protein
LFEIIFFWMWMTGDELPIRQLLQF